MAIDSAAKRAAVATVGAPINAPSVIPNAVITSFDRYQISWSYRTSSAGALMFFGTEISDVTDNWGGVTFDDGGNLNASGTLYEKGV